MKTYCIYVFTQDLCEPCQRLKKHVDTLSEDEIKEVKFVPMKTAYGNGRTALAQDLDIEQTPTLVVVHEELRCKVDADGDEDCDPAEIEVERFVGANAIIEHLDATIDAYTYAHPE
jgi:hypothetical protein